MCIKFFLDTSIPTLSLYFISIYIYKVTTALRSDHHIKNLLGYLNPVLIPTPHKHLYL